MPDNTPTTIAGTRWADELNLREPANSAPPPSPGFRVVDQSLFYVTTAGECWLVRDQFGRVQLTPASLPLDARVVGDDAIDVDIATVTEAADTLGANRPEGFYQDSGVFYCVTSERRVVMIYGSGLAVVYLPSLPPSAKAADVVPPRVSDAVAMAVAV